MPLGTDPDYKKVKYNFMKFLSLLAVTAFLFSSCSEKTVPNSPTNNQLKVLTYNIHHANPPSKTVAGAKVDVIDIDAIVGAIKKENPDVIAMQELDKFVPRSGNIDEAKIIAEKLGMSYKFFKSIDYNGGEYGIAIFSKYELQNPKQLILPKTDPKVETRSLAYTDMLVNGEKLTFACTHLDVTGEASRVLQVKAIVKELEGISHPIILCGDLNSSEGSESISLLLQSFKNSCEGNCGFTVPAVNPKRNIDFIVTRNVGWPITEYHVVTESYASDHRPVTATFKLR